MVFIAGPFRGKTPWDIEENIRVAERAGLGVARKGMVPLIPHSMYRFFQDSLPDSFWLEATGRLLAGADAMLLVGDWKQSAGVKGEIKIAEEEFIPVFETIDDLAEWRNAEC